MRMRKGHKNCGSLYYSFLLQLDFIVTCSWYPRNLLLSPTGLVPVIYLAIYGRCCVVNRKYSLNLWVKLNYIFPSGLNLYSRINLWKVFFGQSMECRGTSRYGKIFTYRSFRDGFGVVLLMSDLFL